MRRLWPVLLLLSACGGGDAASPSAPANAIRLAVSAGQGQSAVAGRAVSVAPSVVVTSSSQSPLAGVTVSFAVGTGGGSITTSTAITGADGIATLSGAWTLGTSPGTNTLTASVTGAAGSPVTFTATGTPVVRTLTVNVGGAPQTATAGTIVPLAPSVILTESGAPAVGVTVTFAVTAGGGTLTGASAVTNAGGIATLGSWTLGSTPGANVVTATASGYTGSPATFAATGLAPSIAGVWNGLVGTQALAVTMVESGGVVTGNGTLSNTPSGLRALTLAGTFVNSSLTGTFTSGTTTPFSIQATLSGNVLSGTLNGSGFAGDRVVLHRAGSTVANANEWIGQYRIVTVDGRSVPARDFVSQLGYATSVISRALSINADGTGTWADSTTSSLFCTPVTRTGPQCSAGGTANVAWSASGSAMTVVRSTNTGFVLSAMSFTKQADGSLLKNDNSATEVYRKP